MLLFFTLTNIQVLINRMAGNFLKNVGGERVNIVDKILNFLKMGVISAG